ncbi:MAG: hypothetical protein M0P69_03750 [Bacteroidales bacterium]|jgi:hypothetical protein|nr:hypothetical protein [Bacteroidales bacterium]
MKDETVKASLALCNKNGRFLFEVRPDIFPEGYLTDLELEMWGDYLKELHRG